MTPPIATTRSPSRITSDATSAARAPSAMRTPISRVRCPTSYEITPYTPTAASNSASAPNTPSIAAPSRNGSVSCRTIGSFFTRWTSANGSCGAAVCIARRTVSATIAGSPAARATMSRSLSDPRACASGRYTVFDESSKMLCRRTFSTTPITVAHGRLSAPMRRQRPTAFSWPHARVASISLMMTTRGAPSWSPSEKSRPPSSDVPSVRK